MARTSYTRADTEQNIRHLLGDSMIEKIPQQEWDALDDFADYLSELHAKAMQQTHGGTLKVKEYEDFLRVYDARMKNLMRSMNLFVDNNGTMMADLFGDYGHFSPYYLIFDNAKTKLLFLLLVKIFYSFIKDYGEDGPNAGTMGNQTDLPAFLAGNQ